jgi:histidinol dehydrogenase
MTTQTRTNQMLTTISAEAALSRRSKSAINAETLQQASHIIEQVRVGGEVVLRELVARYDRPAANQPLVLCRSECATALASLPASDAALLRRVAQRIEAFARAQLATQQPTELTIPGGAAGSQWFPLTAAGCYVPGGRYPLISSLLMTAVTARVAGVEQVWVACPAPSPTMLAAAAIAGVDGFLVAGGAHAIAALAYGIGGPPSCDVVVGPGNRWVTAAKQLVAADVRIDMLAGPSELLLVADESADPATVAADLLAQAEHDVDARPMLIATSAVFVAQVNEAIADQLKMLPTAKVALAALQNGFAVLASDADSIVRLCQTIAPEHLELHLKDARSLAPRFTRCGCLFIGSGSAEVLGDYGAGPNHVLPTGGTARFASGLSVDTFLRRQTWLQMDDLPAALPLVDDTVQLASWEGLAGHAKSAECRRR